MKRFCPHWPLMLSVCLDHLSLNIMFPVLSFIFFDKTSRLFPAATAHATRSLWYGLCISVPYFIGIISVPLLSAASDHYGRKKILLLGAMGAFIYALFLSAGIIQGSVIFLLAGYIIGGLCARTEPIALATLLDTSSAETRVIRIAHLQVMISIGAFLGPLIGGHFAHSVGFSTLNFALPSLIAAAFALATILVILFFLDETKQKSSTKPSPKKILRQLFNASNLLLVTLLLLVQISWSTYYQFIPTVLKLHWNVPPANVGIFVGLIAGWLVLATTVGIRILKYFFSEDKIFLVGVSLLLGGLMITNLATFMDKAWVVWFAAPFVAGGDVIAYCILVHYFAQSVSMEDQGKMMGLIFLVVSIAWALTGLFGGMLGAINPLLPIRVSPVFVALLLMLHFLKRGNGGLLG